MSRESHLKTWGDVLLIPDRGAGRLVDILSKLSNSALEDTSYHSSRVRLVDILSKLSNYALEDTS
jgi:hypothetical protein